MSVEGAQGNILIMHLAVLKSKYLSNFKSTIKKQPLLLFLVLIRSEYKFKINSTGHYSQFGEDQILDKLLPEKKGFFLDIGAGRPIRGSNTYLFYKRGWNGILIDPLTTNYFLSKIFRPKDKKIKALVSTSAENVIFYELKPYEYSTTDKHRVDELINSKRAVLTKKMKLKSISISDLYFNINENLPSLLSIDCEGLDFEVLKSINFQACRFRVVCVEDFDYVDNNKGSAINSYMENQGYKLVNRKNVSSIYLFSSVQKNYL